MTNIVIVVDHAEFNLVKKQSQQYIQIK